MDKKQKMLLAGGGFLAVAAVLLLGSSAKAAPVQPQPQPKPKPFQPSGFDARVDDTVHQTSTSTVDSPFGPFVPCSNGTTTEPYRSSILDAIGSSYDLSALHQGVSTFQAADCSELTQACITRIGQLSPPTIAGYGQAQSACDTSGQMVDGIERDKIVQWIQQQTDANVLAQAAQALRAAEPTCGELAAMAQTRSDQINAAVRDAQAAQQQALAQAMQFASAADQANS